MCNNTCDAELQSLDCAVGAKKSNALRRGQARLGSERKNRAKEPHPSLSICRNTKYSQNGGAPFGYS